MDFEDGERPPLAGGRGGREAAWPALGVCLPTQDGRVGFVLRAQGRPPAAGPVPGEVAPGGPARPESPASPPPVVRGGLGVPRGPGRGRTRPERHGLRPQPGTRCVEIAPTPPTSRWRAGERGRLPPPTPPACARPQGGGPVSKRSAPGTALRGLFAGGVPGVSVKTG